MDTIYKIMFSIIGVVILSILIHIVFHVIVHKSFHSKPVARIFGFFVAVVGAFMFITFYNELREIPATPKQLSIEEIPLAISKKDHLWVSIRDGKWDCNNIAHNETDTFAVLLNKDETLVIVANFDKKVTCEELTGTQPTGRLDEFVDREVLYTSKYINFSNYEHMISFLSLCAYCGRENSQLGIIMGIFFALLGLFYYKVIPLSR